MKILPENLTPDFVAFRRALFFGAILATTGLGAWFLWRYFRADGITILEAIQLGLFILLFQQIAAGFWLSLIGFVIRLTGGDPAQISHTLDRKFAAAVPSGATAIVVPIFNEDVARVFRGIDAMWTALQQTGNDGGFELFVLSDSSDTGTWVAEELAWFDLCRRRNAFGRIFYRKRRLSQNGKSGNIADFCRRWGARYRYMIVLDADSILTSQLLCRLVAMMERNPRVGLIQTAPKLVLGRSLFRRMQQFASQVYSPMFSAGSNYWHLFGANYWGHNAIIRVAPFMQHCALPELPEPDARRRHILSHDTVEAALMRKAGYDVWHAYDEAGSYEEGPPNLAASLARDRRWCQGNMQHFWFLFAPGIDFANRFHIWTGLMAYGGGALWFLFLLVGAVDLAGKQRLSHLSASPEDLITQNGGALLVLLIATLCLLFVPKFLAAMLAIRHAKCFGGVARMGCSVVLETLTWVLLAPVMMWYYTRFVLTGLLGLHLKWEAQDRQEDGLSFPDALRAFWQPPILAIGAGIALAAHLPQHILLVSPILAGWLLAPAMAWITSLPKTGEFTRRRGLFLIPEEHASSTPCELQAAQPPENTPPPIRCGLIRTLTDPVANAVHISLLRRKTAHKATADYLAALRERLAVGGPEGLAGDERDALLWDADSLCRLHRDIWSADRPPAWLADSGESIP